MPTIRLTKEAVENLAPPSAGQEYYWDEDQAGFGVVIGHTGVRSYVVTGRVRGVKGSDGKDIKRRVTIGVVGARRDDGHEWALRLARDAAKVILADMARGIDPNATKRKPAPPSAASGPTLRDGLEAHLARMRKKHRSERTIHTFETELKRHLADWLDRPIVDLTGAVLVDLHEKIKKQAAPRAGSNPGNDRGAPLANRVITHVSAAWNSLNKKFEGRLGTWNPAKAVDKDVLKPKRERVVDLADYAKRVATMRNPIQRDGLMFALYTGLRSEDVRTVRFDHVDFDARTLVLPDPKGGEEAAFEIPLSPHAFEILERRKRDNARDLGAPHGGWAFPAINNKGATGPIGDLRQQVHGAKHGRFPAEDVHTLRRTYLSIAEEEGVSELDQHVLSNHTFGTRSVNQTYIAQHIDHLAACAAKIDAGITSRIDAGSSSTRARRVAGSERRGARRA